MVRNILILLIVTLLVSCSVSKKIERRYEGNGREMIINDFGEPQRIVDLKDGKQMFIYVKETYIRETNIGTGSFTLDPRVSPGFIKEETYRFIIDEQGIISSASYEKKQK